MSHGNLTTRARQTSRRRQTRSSSQSVSVQRARKSRAGVTRPSARQVRERITAPGQASRDRQRQERAKVSEVNKKLQAERRRGLIAGTLDPDAPVETRERRQQIQRREFTRAEKIDRGLDPNKQFFEATGRGRTGVQRVLEDQETRLRGSEFLPQPGAGGRPGGLGFSPEGQRRREQRQRDVQRGTEQPTDAGQLRKNIEESKKREKDLDEPTIGKGQSATEQLASDLDNFREQRRLERQRRLDKEELQKQEQQAEDLKKQTAGGVTSTEDGSEAGPSFGSKLIDTGMIASDIAGAFSLGDELRQDRLDFSAGARDQVLDNAADNRSLAMMLREEGRGDAMTMLNNKLSDADDIKKLNTARENETERRSLARLEQEQLEFNIDSARAEQVLRDNNIQSEMQRQRLSAKLGFGFDTNGIDWMQTQSRKASEALSFAIQKTALGSLDFSRRMDNVIADHRLGMLRIDTNFNIKQSQAYNSYTLDIKSVREDFYATEKDVRNAETKAWTEYSKQRDTLFKEHGDDYKERDILTRQEVSKAEVVNRQRQQDVIDLYQDHIDTFSDTAPGRLEAIREMAREMGINPDLITNDASVEQVEKLKGDFNAGLFGRMTGQFIDDKTQRDYGKILFDSIRNLPDAKAKRVVPESMSIIGSQSKSEVFDAVKKNIRGSLLATERTDLDSFETYISESQGIIDFVNDKADSFGGRWTNAVAKAQTWNAFKESPFMSEETREEIIQMQARIELYISDVRRQKFGTALTGTELISAERFLINFDKDEVRQIKTKMKEMKEFYERRRERKYDNILGSGTYQFLTGEGSGASTTKFDNPEFDSVEQQDGFMEDVFGGDTGEDLSFNMKSGTFDGRNVTLRPEALVAFRNANKDFKAKHGRDLTIGSIALSSFRRQEDAIASVARDVGIQFNSRNPNETAARLRKMGRQVADVERSMHPRGLAVDMFPGEVRIGGKTLTSKQYIALIKPFLKKYGFNQLAASAGDPGHFEFTS